MNTRVCVARLRAAATILTAAAIAPAARAQLSLESHVISAGGLTTPATGGSFHLQCTIGDAAAGASLTGGRFSVSGGFLPGAAGGPAACYANCDGSTIAPILNVNDFICFQTKYAAGDPAANCDGSTIPPVLNVNDFICFQTMYAAGCP